MDSVEELEAKYEGSPSWWCLQMDLSFPERAISPPQLFVASRTKLSMYPSNFPDITIPDDFNITNMLVNRNHAVALAVDLEDGLVFYSDVATKAIGMASLRVGSTVRYITGATSSVEGSIILRHILFMLMITALL